MEQLVVESLEVVLGEALEEALEAVLEMEEVLADKVIELACIEFADGVDEH